MSDIEKIKFGDIEISLPKGDAKAIAKARKLLDLYEEHVSEEKEKQKPG